VAGAALAARDIKPQSFTVFDVEPFDHVFDLEAQTRRELRAEGLVADWNL
jgi:hypothetical protein